MQWKAIASHLYYFFKEVFQTGIAEFFLVGLFFMVDQKWPDQEGFTALWGNVPYFIHF